MPLLLTVISATGIGVSFPAQSTSLIGSHRKDIDANFEAPLILAKDWCLPEDPCNYPGSNRNPAPAQSPSVNSDRDPIEKPTIEKPTIEKPAIEKPTIEKPAIENRTRYQRQRLPEQQPTKEPSPTIEQLPTVKPSPNN